MGDQVLRFCNKSDFHPRVSCRSAQIETVQALVRTGLGISLIAAMAKQTKGALAPLYRSLKRPRPERTLVALWPRQRQPGRAAAAFLEHARAGR